MTCFLQQKVCIISSKDESCGNASYSKQLSESLKMKYQTVDIIPLNQASIHKNGDFKKVMKFVCNEVKKYDCINIQYESILYGGSHRSIKFLRNILENCNGKAVLFTIHSYYRTRYSLASLIARTVLHKMMFFSKSARLKFRKIKGEFNKHKQANHCAKVINLIKSYQKNISINIVTHKKSTSDAITVQHKISAYHHPLIMPHQQDVERLNVKNAREKILRKYNLDANNIYIGIFGYHGQYKGFDVVLNAIKLLPTNYHIIMSCQVHPQASFATHHYHPHDEIIRIDNILLGKSDKNNNDVNLIAQERIHFINHLEEQEFKEVIAGVDICTFTYYDVDQGGSGPLSYAVYLNHIGNIIITTNRAFMEYEKCYYPKCFTFIDQGNVLELAYKIKNIQNGINKTHFEEACRKYNPHTNMELYCKLMTHDPY